MQTPCVIIATQQHSDTARMAGLATAARDQFTQSGKILQFTLSTRPDHETDTVIIDDVYFTDSAAFHVARAQPQ